MIALEPACPHVKGASTMPSELTTCDTIAFFLTEERRQPLPRMKFPFENNYYKITQLFN